MSRCAPSLFGLLLVVSAVPVFAQNAQSTREQFLELGRLLEGRWASQITLIADWPGLKAKQGDKVNGYTTVNWIADGNALSEEELVAESVAKSIYHFDAGAKQIKATRVDSAGTTATTTFWKQGDVWHWKHVAHQLSGDKVTGSGTLVFRDGGKTMIGDGTVFLNGKELPRYHDVYRRVSNK